MNIEIRCAIEYSVRPTGSVAEHYDIMEHAHMYEVSFDAPLSTGELNSRQM